MYTRLEKILDKIAYFFYPDDCTCVMCSKEIPRESKYTFCEECLAKMPLNNKQICVRCGKPMENEALYCLECQNHIKYFDFARSSLVYENQAVQLIHMLKFGNKKWLARPLAKFLIATYHENALDPDMIIPVPISKSRKRKRGYNQARELAKYLSVSVGVEMEEDVIIKHKDNLPQAKLNSRDRRENVVGVYKVIDRAKVKGKKVLIVDDILTTGSTASEMARKLKIAGASAVYVLTVATPRYKVPAESMEDTAEIDYTELEEK